MTEDDANQNHSASTLRKRAEEKSRAGEAKTQEMLSPEETRRTLQELRVHQIELDMQNEELRRVQAELEASRAGEINQVILIMIVNAAHAIGDVVVGTEQKGKIVITTRQEGGWAAIEVADTGSGIPEEIRAHIFDPFFTTKEVGRRTGQGLAIARNVILDKHGGTISVESEIGKGTTFIIRLPIQAGEQTR